MFTENLKLEQREHTLYWTNFSDKVDLASARQVSDRIKALITTQTIDQVIVDNRKITAHWPQEVDHIWIDLMRFMPLHVKKTATLCPDVIFKLELNYLSAKAGTTDSVRAFTPDEMALLLEFLNVSVLDLDFEDAPPQDTTL